MFKKISPWISQNTRRVIGLALAPGLLTVAFEVWVAHYAGKSGSKLAQIFPVYFGIAAGGILLLVCLFRFNSKLFANTLRILGGGAILIGCVGVYFHAVSLYDQFEDKTIDAETIEVALNEAPPTFAPLAFVGIGVILLLLTSPHFHIQINLDRNPD